MKLQHRSGLFGENCGEYYMEYIETPYKLVCKYLQNKPDVDITNGWVKKSVDKNIKEGVWVEILLVLCPICDEGMLCPIIDAEIIEYKGVTAPVEYHFSQCDVCSSELAGKDEVSLNNRAMTAFYKQVDGDNV